MAYTGSKAFAGEGTDIQRGDGASPEVFTHIAEMKKVVRSGMKMDFVDVTNFDSIGAYREYVATLLDGGELQIEGNYIPNDATQASLQADFDGRVLHNWKFILPPGPGFQTSEGTWNFKAYVSDFPWDVQHDKEATVNFKLRTTGKPTFTAGS